MKIEKGIKNDNLDIKIKTDDIVILKFLDVGITEEIKFLESYLEKVSLTKNEKTKIRNKIEKYKEYIKIVDYK